MKENVKRLLMELLKDSRRSDRELARRLGVSQPSISRMRKKLVKDRVIRDFTVIPDFARLGYEIMAVTIAKAKITLGATEQEKAKKLVLTNPNVIFVASAEGMGMNGVMISFHKNYSDYANFITELKRECTGYMEKVERVLISLEPSNIIKPLSLATLARSIVTPPTPQNNHPKS